MENFYEYEEEFRDHMGTVDEEGKRIWVYPKKPKGKFTNYRVIVAVILLGVLFSVPFIKIGSQPLFLFNIFERKFIILGVAFWPQDFYIFALVLISFFVFIILFTVVFGRVWCGWACPQTIFMEMVFRRIEYWLEGDANHQRKLNNGPWTTEKIFKKGFKQILFILISLLIAHTLMAYIIGVDQVVDIVSSPPAENWGGFMATMVFTVIFYWVFTYFREQACIAACPYGRLQGVLLNRDSMAVAYDFVRGEPRGKIHKGEVAEDQGDCIDCNLCVHACPTGIDIRNGTQLECINCTACMDACDEVMEKVGKPKGLVRISSYTNIKEGKSKVFTTRVIAYIIVLLALITIATTLLISRSDVDATVLRVPGQLYQKTENGKIRNLMNVLFVNKTFDAQDVELRLVGQPNAVITIVGGEDISLEPNSTKEIVMFVDMPPEEVDGAKTKIYFEVVRNGEVIDETHTNFLGPFTFN
ncbi:MAG: cytochrome c oxidase accessory protein CcoG [Bacteroidota bacterium]